MKALNKELVKQVVSILAFITAVVIGFIALFIPPAGIIDASVLWFTAQLLVFVSGLLGIDLSIDAGKKTVSTSKLSDKKDEE